MADNLNENRDIDLAQATVIATGTLRKNGESYSVIRLEEKHIPQMAALHDRVYNDLAPSDKTFMLHKDTAYFTRHFAQSHTGIGIVHNGKLVAHGLLHLPTKQYPNTEMGDFKKKIKPQDIAVMLNLQVHPDSRGHSLMSIVISSLMNQAQKRGRKHLLSEVDVRNTASWYSFMKEGLKIHSIGDDPRDGAVLYNMHAKTKPLMKHRLSKTFNAMAAKKNADIPQNEITRQRGLLKKGWHGVSYNTKQNTLGFRRPNLARRVINTFKRTG